MKRNKKEIVKRMYQLTDIHFFPFFDKMTKQKRNQVVEKKEMKKDLRLKC